MLNHEAFIIYIIIIIIFSFLMVSLRGNQNKTFFFNLQKKNNISNL